MRREVRLTLRGAKQEVLHPYFIEFIQRKRLSELGYSFDSKELSADKAEAFLFISSVISEFEAEEMKKRQRK